MINRPKAMHAPRLFARCAPAARIAACATLACALHARADETTMLVSCFATDTIAGFVPSSGAPLGVIGPSTGLDAPLCARIGPDGLLYVASEGTNEVLRYNPSSGALVDVFVAAGAGGLNAPTGMSWGPDGNLYVSSFNTDAVLKYHGQTGAFLSVFVASGASGLNGPDNGMVFGPDGNLYVPAYYTNRVYRFNGVTGAYMGLMGGVINKPRVLIFDGPDLLVTSEASDAVHRINAATGASLGFKVAPGAGGLDLPIGLAKGPDGDLYVSSGSQHCVYRFDGTTGAFESIVLPTGTAGVSTPVFVTFVPAAPDPDLDGDGAVGGADLGMLLSQWNTPGLADLTADGTVDGADLGALLAAWDA